MAAVESTESLTVGEIRFGSMVNGVIAYLDDIDFFTSTTYIKEGYNKVVQLAVDVMFMLPPGKKQTYIKGKLVEVAAYFKAQWKGLDGDRSGYLLKTDLIEKLKGILVVLDIPSAQFEASMPAMTPEVIAKTPIPAPLPMDPADMKPAPEGEKPSAQPAKVPEAKDVGTDEEKAKAAEEARAKEEEEKKKQPWLKRQTYGVPNWGWLVSGGLLLLAMGTGGTAAVMKRGRGRATPMQTPLATAVANARRMFQAPARNPYRGYKTVRWN